MSRKLALCGAAAATLAASMLVTPAHAAEDFPITVSPTTAKPAEKVTVSGTAADPTCADDGVAVSLHYTKPDGTSAATTVNTTTDADGAFTAELTVPDNATAGEAAHVAAVIADCTPPEGESAPRSSESVTFTVAAYQGDLELSAAKGKPGETIGFAGDNCWGGMAAFFFGDEEPLVGEPEADRTFAGEFELPDLPDGTYQVTASCPGTDYKVLSFRIVNPAVIAPPAAPPAKPITRRPTFTG